MGRKNIIDATGRGLLLHQPNLMVITKKSRILLAGIVLTIHVFYEKPYMLKNISCIILNKSKLLNL